MQNRADYVGPDGNLYVDVEGKTYRADSLAWMYVTGEWHDTIIHMDGDPLNNKFANLRPEKTN